MSFKVAPFEADAQLAYEVISGHFGFAIADDQDVALYGPCIIVQKLGDKRCNYAAGVCDVLNTTNWVGGIEKCSECIRHPGRIVCTGNTCSKAVGFNISQVRAASGGCVHIYGSHEGSKSRQDLIVGGIFCVYTCSYVH